MAIAEFGKKIEKILGLGSNEIQQTVVPPTEEVFGESRGFIELAAAQLKLRLMGLLGEGNESQQTDIMEAESEVELMLDKGVGLPPPTAVALGRQILGLFSGTSEQPKALTGAELAAANKDYAIRKSFTEMNPMRAGMRLVPVPKSKGFMCQEIIDEKGDPQAAYWLNRRAWAAPLRDLLKFAKERGFEKIQYLVLQHNVESFSQQSILLKPIKTENGTVYESNSTLSLTTGNRLTVGGREGVPVVDLGILNPERMAEKAKNLIGKREKLPEDNLPRLKMRGGKMRWVK